MADYGRVLDTNCGQALRVSPPEELIKLVGGAYERVGEEFSGYLKKYCGLQTNHAVLDMGSGCGRIALPLTGYLSSEGRYEGLEICLPSVRWCQEAVTPERPNFKFQHADIYNGFYNPGGKQQARDYVFPYPDETFDAVLFISVFTHMLPEDISQYLAQTRRVLKPGGKMLATFFLINEDSQKAIREKNHPFPYVRTAAGYYICNSKIHEDVVAQDERWILQQLRENGFSAPPAVYYGSWARRSGFLSFQDMMIVTKESVNP